MDERDNGCFRFLQINDLHMKAPDSDDRREGYVGANKRGTWLLDGCSGRHPILDVDFVLGIGDMVHGETLEGIRRDLDGFKAAIQDLPCPFYPLMGNHEVKQRQSDSEWTAPFLETFGDQMNNYVVQHGGIVFVMFNNGGTGNLSERVRIEQNRWLCDTLETYAGLPKILCCHVPLVPIRETAVLAESFGFQSFRALEPEVLDLVEAHAHTVLAVLSGHLHLTGMVLQNTIHHVCVAGTASYPSDYAVYTAFDDRIEVSIQQVALDMLDMSETNIHGQKRHLKDYVDQAHSTHQAYLMGNSEERAFTIARK